MKYKYLLIVLLLIPLAYALEECAQETEPYYIPCQVTTTWEYPGACNNYTASIYDTNGALLDVRTLDTFAGYCSFTFNYTAIGSYYFNISAGDTGGIVVVEKMQQLTNFLVFGGYLIAQFILIIFIHVFKKDRGASMVYGGIASVLSFIMAGILLSGFQVVSGVTFIIDVNYYLVALAVAIGLYTSMISWAFYNDLKGKATEFY